MLVNAVIFGVLALLVIATAAGMVLFRNAVYSALFLALNFVTVGVLYLILGAPFIALVQVTVYAGSIMVLFLFVIMLLGTENMPVAIREKEQSGLGILLGVVLLGVLGYLEFGRGLTSRLVTTPPEDFASPMAIGVTLFNSYALLFLVTSIILLTATVGAILLTRGDRAAGGKKEE
jgi:NADH-quinone oxidoreductase subunit J